MKRLNIFIVILIILNISCEESTEVQIIPVDSPVPYIQITNDLNNSNVLRDEADVRMAWVNADTLYLKVQYGGGCKEHTFQLYVLNYFLKSNPPQAEVRLSHNSRFDHCEAYLTDTLRFNLSPLRMLYKQIYSSPKGIVLLNIYEPQATQVTSPHVNYSF